MKIAIIGGGAIGMLCCFYLQQTHEVTLYVRRKDQKEQLNTNGLHLVFNNESYKNNVQVKLLTEASFNEDLFILTMKQYDVEPVITLLKEKINPNQVILFLQNGMSHLSYLSSLEGQAIAIGIVEHGALKLNDSTVKHTGLGRIKVSAVQHSFQSIQSFIKEDIENFPFVLVENFYEMLSKKLIVNAIINPLTAILKVENGCLGNNESFKLIVDELIDEICPILSLDKVEMNQHVFQVINQTATNKSSMLKDVEHQRKTEIEAILGYLLEEAKTKILPANRIYLLYLMVKGIESEV